MILLTLLLHSCSLFDAKCRYYFFIGMSLRQILIHEKLLFSHKFLLTDMNGRMENITVLITMIPSSLKCMGQMEVRFSYRVNINKSCSYFYL